MENQYNQYNLEASFRIYLAAENISPVSLKNYLSDLRHFLGWIQSNQNGSPLVVRPLQNNQKNVILANRQPLVRPASTDSGVANAPQNDVFQGITESRIAEYKSYLRENDVPDKTINRRLSTLRKFFTFAISQGWTKENPAKKVSNIVSFTNLRDQETGREVDPERPADRTGQDLSLQDIISKYESSLEQKGLGKAEINENMTVVRQLLEIPD